MKITCRRDPYCYQTEAAGKSGPVSQHSASLAHSSNANETGQQ